MCIRRSLKDRLARTSSLAPRMPQDGVQAAIGLPSLSALRVALGLRQTSPASPIGTLEKFVEPLHIGGSRCALSYTSPSEISLTFIDRAETNARTDAVETDQLRTASRIWVHAPS